MASFVGGKKKKSGSVSREASPRPGGETATTSTATTSRATTSRPTEDVTTTAAGGQSSSEANTGGGTTSPSPAVMGVGFLMFWSGLVVGVLVSGLAAWRIYTVNMAEREERMVQEMLEQEARMEQEKQDRFWLGLAMASMISVMAVIQSYRMKMAEREACAKNQQRLRNLLVEKMSRKVAPPPEEEVVVERLQCVVCLTAEREVILLDCGHVCACKLCADTLMREDHQCPVCRAEIRAIKPAFIS